MTCPQRRRNNNRADISNVQRPNTSTTTPQPLTLFTPSALASIRHHLHNCLQNELHNATSPCSSPEKEKAQQSQQSHVSYAESDTLVQSQQSHVSFAESDTLIQSQQSFQNFIVEGEVEGSPNTEPDHDPIQANLDNLIPQVLPLIDRLPRIETVISFMRKHRHFKDIMSTPGVFDSPDDAAKFLDEYFEYSDHDGNFWYDAYLDMMQSLEENMPSCPSQLKKCRDDYHFHTMNLVNDHFRGRNDIILYSWDTVKYTKLQNLSGRIGYLFLDIFELLITPPRGSRIVMIDEQLEELIKTLRPKPLREYLRGG
jgi:hypothetical protein